MKITETIHTFKHQFRLALSENYYVDRFVYSYILLGKDICLIDAGVRGMTPLLQNYMKQINRSPGEISVVALTHAHPDHIGGCLAIKKTSSASTERNNGMSRDEKGMEDTGNHFQEVLT